MKIDSFILLLFYPLLLIDSINGFFLLNGSGLPISQAYKLTLMIILFARLSFISMKNFLFALSLLVYTSGVTFFFIVYLSSSFEKPMSVLFIFLKFFFFVITFFYFEKTILKSDDHIKSAKNICFFNFSVIIINLVLGIMGYGFPIYTATDSDVSIGVKGYFYAGNELSAVYIILVAVVLAHFVPLIKKKSLLYLTVLICFLFSATLATKTAIGGTFILSTATIFYHKKYIEKTPFNIRNILVATFSLLFTSLISLYFFIKSAAFERMMYYYNDLSNIYRFLMSGRDQFLSRKTFIFASANNVFNFLFGMGEYVSVEMDLFDTFFTFGLIGTALFYSIYFYFNRHIYFYFKEKRRSFSENIINISLIMIFIQSFISGHVLYSGMATLFYSFSLVFSKYYCKNSNI